MLMNSDFMYTTGGLKLGKLVELQGQPVACFFSEVLHPLCKPCLPYASGRHDASSGLDLQDHAQIHISQVTSVGGRQDVREDAAALRVDAAATGSRAAASPMMLRLTSGQENCVPTTSRDSGSAQASYFRSVYTWTITLQV